jgi:G3E family GTPase
MDPDMARTAVVINELGEIGLDHALIATGVGTALFCSRTAVCVAACGAIS